MCNGVEVGGGSLRVYRPDVQARVFRLMGLAEGEARARFGHLMEALEVCVCVCVGGERHGGHGGSGGPDGVGARGAWIAIPPW